LAKNTVVLAVGAAMVFWTVGLTAFIPQQAAAASFGDLIKGETLSTVYYYGSDGQRYSFPNEKTFFTWYSDFSGVVTITDEELADITLAGNIVYRPGARWVKISSDDKVYATSSDGSIHWVEDEATAVGLAGDSWNTFIDDVPDVFFVDYTVGDSLTDASDGYEGMLWSDGTDNYLITDGSARKVSSAGMSANGYQSGFVLSGTGVSLSGLTSGTDLAAKESNLTDAAQMVETTTYAESQDVSVGLSASSPSASTLLESQGLAHLASYDFTNSTSADVVVTSFAVNRTGVSSDSTTSNMYLFEGWVRTSDSATLSSGRATWNDSAGLFTVPAGSTLTVSVRSNIAASTSGQTVGVQLAAASDIGFSGSYAAAGSFPISGATHTIASAPSTFTSISFASSTTPSAASVDAQADLNVWQNTVSVTTNEALLHTLRFRNIGSIAKADVGNFRLYVAGVMKGSAVAQQNGDGYVTFDLSADPVRLNTGNHVVKVLADVTGGSGRTITMTLRDAADAVFVDEDYGQADLVLANSTTFSARSAGAQTVNSGTLTFTKMSTSPSGDITNTASGATLGKYEVKAFGENLKIESLRFTFTAVDTNDAADDDIGSLRNGAVYADGTQVGSTSTLNEDSQATAYTEYTFGSSLVVYPGTPVTLEVRADVYDNDGTDSITATADAEDKITASIPAHAATNNVYRMTTGDYVSRPAAAVSANQLTIKQGALTVAKNTAYANQTVVDPLVEYKVGSWTVYAGTTEDINLNTINVDFDADDDAGAALATADYTNLYIKYGPAGDQTTSTIKGTVTTANSWSINYLLAKGETIYVDAYADVGDDAADGTDGADTLKAELDVSGTTSEAAASVSGSDKEGQTITYMSSGTFATSLDGSSPVAFATAGGQEVTAAKYRFTATNDSFTISKVQLSVASGAVGVPTEARLYDGDELLGTAVFNQTSGDSVANGAALISGLSIEVPTNSYKVLTGKLLFGTIGSGGASVAANSALTLDSVTYANGQGVQQSAAATDRDGNEIRVWKSLPTFSHVDLTNSTLVNGQATDLYKFTVTADSQGSIALKQVNFTVSWTDGGGAGDTLEVESMKLYKNGSDITDSVLLQEEDANTVESTSGLLEGDEDLFISWATEEVISAGETVTYVVRGTPQGFNVTDASSSNNTDYFSMYLTGDTSNTNLTTLVCLNDDTEVATIDQLLAESSNDCSETADADAVLKNIIWSDFSSSTHQDNMADYSGDTDGGDWFSSYKVKNLPLGAETWTK